MDYIFTTERLGFRYWSDKDKSPFFEMNSDPAVMEFFPKLQTQEESNALLHKIESHFELKGFGLYAVDYLEDQIFIGFIGLSPVPFEAAFTPAVEIGWRLRKEFWGRGLAPEGAKKCMELGFTNFGLDKIVSFTSLLNKKSIRVMEKIGLRYQEQFDHPKLDRSDKLCPHVLYALRKDQLIEQSQ